MAVDEDVRGEETAGREEGIESRDKEKESRVGIVSEAETTRDVVNKISRKMMRRRREGIRGIDDDDFLLLMFLELMEAKKGK